MDKKHSGSKKFRNHNIIRANRAEEEMLYLPLLEIIRAKCFMYYHGADKPLVGCPSCKCIKTSHQQGGISGLHILLAEDSILNMKNEMRRRQSENLNS